ncbi:unnamed protein product, partial [Laminaria digitata]
PTPASFRDHCQSNVVEEIDSGYEDDFKIVSARGSYEYVFVPWGHTLVPKRVDGIGKPVPPLEGRQRDIHDCRRSRDTVSHHEGAEGALSCRNLADNLWRNGLGVDTDNALDLGDSWSDGREASSTQSG